MKTADLLGPALDWAVAQAEGELARHDADVPVFCFWQSKGLNCYSTDWSQGGPIIERKRISVVDGLDNNIPCWQADIDPSLSTRPSLELGPTPLVAAMRCYVASELGDEVQIPPELASSV